MEITKRWLKSKSACQEGIDWVIANCNGKEGVDVVKALMADNKLDWANWLIVRIMTRPQYLTYAIYSAEQVLPIFEKKYPNDTRPRLAIEATKAVLKDDTPENRKTAKAALTAAWAAAGAVGLGEGDMAGAAWVARAVAWIGKAATWAMARSIAEVAVEAAVAAAEEAMKTKILEYGLKLLNEEKTNVS